MAKANKYLHQEFSGSSLSVISEKHRPKYHTSVQLQHRPKLHSFNCDEHKTKFRRYTIIILDTFLLGGFASHNITRRRNADPTAIMVWHLCLSSSSVNIQTEAPYKMSLFVSGTKHNVVELRQHRTRVCGFRTWRWTSWQYFLWIQICDSMAFPQRDIKQINLRICSLRDSLHRWRNKGYFRFLNHSARWVVSFADLISMIW